MNTIDTDSQMKTLERQLQLIENLKATLSREIAKLRQQPPAAAPVESSHGHLELVTEDFNGSKYREKMIRNELRAKNFAPSLARRTERIERLHGRKGLVEMMFEPATRRIVRRVYLDGTLIEEIAVAAVNKGQLRECFDALSRAIVPWRSIEAGEPWREEVLLSPFYLDDVLPAGNVIDVDFAKRIAKRRNECMVFKNSF